MAEKKPITLGIKQISRPNDLQIRESLRSDHIDDLTNALKAGETLPPVHVVREANCYWLVDGHHRVAAYDQAGINDVPAIVVQDGTRADARWMACAANREHNALKRSNADKRRAVEAAIQAQPKASARAIAEHVGVSVEMVAAVKNPNAPSRNKKTKDSELSESDTPEPKGIIGGDPRACPANECETPDAPSPSSAHSTSDSTTENQEQSAQEGEEAADSEEGEATDQAGNRVPARLVDVFDAAGRWRRIAREIGKATKQIVSEQDQAHAMMLEVGSFKQFANGAANRVRAAAPYAVHAECRGEGCEDCAGRGWLTQSEYKLEIKDAEAAT